jgi:glucose-1-phosphate adenylyltransferase
MNRDVVGVILGGGRGSRLYPLTKQRAKPAVPIAGKYRLIDIPISNCINSEISKIYVLTQFLSASLHVHVSQTYKFDAFSRGFVELLPAEQTPSSSSWYQGTADAVRRQLDRLLYHPSRDALILAGDHIYRMDYSDFISFHREKDADVTVAVLPVGCADAHRFGILQADGDRRIRTFREKPSTDQALEGLESLPGQNRPYMASMGIYVFRTGVLADLLRSCPQEDFGHHVIPHAIETQKVFAYPFKGYWEDIGTIGCFYKANLDLASTNPRFSFYDPHRPVYTHARFLPPSVTEGCRMDGTMVAEGCRLAHARLEDCVVGLRSIVSGSAHLRGVVMMGADYYEDALRLRKNRAAGRPNIGVGPGTFIERAIIDKNARIGRNVKIHSHEGQPDAEHETHVVRDGIIVVPKGTTIPDDTVLGEPIQANRREQAHIPAADGDESPLDQDEVSKVASVRID